MTYNPKYGDTPITDEMLDAVWKDFPEVFLGDIVVLYNTKNGKMKLATCDRWITAPLLTRDMYVPCGRFGRKPSKEEFLQKVIHHIRHGGGWEPTIFPPL